MNVFVNHQYVTLCMQDDQVITTKHQNIHCPENCWWMELKWTLFMIHTSKLLPNVVQLRCAMYDLCKYEFDDMFLLILLLVPFFFFSILLLFHVSSSLPLMSSYDVKKIWCPPGKCYQNLKSKFCPRSTYV